MSIAALLQAAEYIERRERGEYRPGAACFFLLASLLFSPSFSSSFLSSRTPRAECCECVRVPCHWHMATNARLPSLDLGTRPLCYASPRIVASATRFFRDFCNLCVDIPFLLFLVFSVYFHEVEGSGIPRPSDFFLLALCSCY